MSEREHWVYVVARPGKVDHLHQRSLVATGREEMEWRKSSWYRYDLINDNLLCSSVLLLCVHGPGQPLSES